VGGLGIFSLNCPNPQLSFTTKVQKFLPNSQWKITVVTGVTDWAKISKSVSTFDIVIISDRLFSSTVYSKPFNDRGDPKLRNDLR
jgi:hypothetical protein